MFQAPIQRNTRARGAISLLERIYHAVVRSIRQSHRNAIMGLFINIAQTLTLVLAMYIMFEILGLRGMSLRGDFLLFIMSGIFVYMTHIKAVSSVMGSEGPASPMMQHAPMNTAIAISAAALSSLYIQVLSLFVVLALYHIIITPLTILYPTYAFGMLLLAWFTGLAVGMIFLALKPWAPGLIGVLSSIYIRVNMFASGKMFVANALPASKLAIFSWNPLFHIIDQGRGFIFLHYNPHFSSWPYALAVGLVLLLVGLLGEFYTRKHVSASWTAGR
ncbi:ABC transporter permease [Yoonia sediminilitoris]|uniref:ABC-type polysaccharide/polyol phosphate export permease n=1 Tax=Yoonia sediminilitoris TaxID=1286148 RepID=A0A2T6KLR0_9RHOB|nr:ABC transporter permease [Yoonia sediminilitoris]PUB17121.1 ABC-type polysaccharide/polyol phosphate export permease [Yoonia sediminilitoris]RCW97416.1 ABC-type polysaccharide/polyol phosphate export permease [Yoonia sediminilitoris]